MITKELAIKALEERKIENSKIEKINNASLHAGSPMYFYCRECGVHVATLPEDYITPPPKYCGECQEMIDAGWIK